MQLMELMEVLDYQRKSSILMLLKEMQNFVWDYIIMLLVNFPTQFSLKSIFNGFCNTECGELPLNGNVYDFSVDCNSIDKSRILQIHSYLITKKNMPQCSALLNKCLLYYWALVFLQQQNVCF